MCLVVFWGVEEVCVGGGGGGGGGAPLIRGRQRAKYQNPQSVQENGIRFTWP